MDNGGGGGAAHDIVDSFWIAKVDLAFIEGENLYNSRADSKSPIKLHFNNQIIYYYSSFTAHPYYAHSYATSISFYPVVHTFLLKEYYKAGFNPNDGEVILDCGAAEGDTALFFNALYPQSDIYSFECNEESYALLEKNIAENNKQHKIKAYKCAVGAKTEKIYFDSWSVVPNKTPTSIEVDCISIDEFVSTHNITNIGLIKMDIEGSEQQALLGAIDTIKKFKPKLMIPIYHKDDDFIEIPKFLHSLQLNMQLSIKWTEIRWGGMDCVLFVKFI